MLLSNYYPSYVVKVIDDDKINELKLTLDKLQKSNTIIKYQNESLAQDYQNQLSIKELQLKYKDLELINKNLELNIKDLQMQLGMARNKQ